MTPSKLRIKDDLYSRLSASETDEMIYKPARGRASSFFHADGDAQGYDHLGQTARNGFKPSPGYRNDDPTDEQAPTKSAFIFPAQFYKNLFAASASLLKKQQHHSQHGPDLHSDDEADGGDEKAEDLSNPSACSSLETALPGVGQFPRGLLSHAVASPEDTSSTVRPQLDRDVETSGSNDVLEKPSNAFPWLSEATNNNDYSKGNNNHHGTPPPPHLHHPHHPHPHHHHHHHHPHHHSHHHPHLGSAGSQSNLGAGAPSGPLAAGNCRHGHPEDSKCRAPNCGPPSSSSPSTSAGLGTTEGATPDAGSTTATATAIPNFNQMPVPGSVQGQNPTQGLVHWMSAVMAEHMTSNPHHDPAAVGMHYMWNGPVEQCGQHTKDMDSYGGWPAPRNPMSMKQGYEAKMNPVDHHHHHHHHHHNNLQKGHMIDERGLLDHHSMPTGAAAQMSQLYGARGTSSSNSPAGGLGHGASNAAAALLVVPQPINATKIGATGLPNGTGRKYQCKMCPQCVPECQTHPSARNKPGLKLEGRIVEYSRPGGGLDYHNSPLIGEIAAGGDYSQFHRSIDQLRSLNERGILASASNTQLTVTFTPIQSNGNNPTVLDYNQQQQQQQQQQHPQQVQQVQQLQQQQQHQQHTQLAQHHLQQQNQKPFLSNGIVTHHDFPLKASTNLNGLGPPPGNISLAVNGLLVGSNGVPLGGDRLTNTHLTVDGGNLTRSNAALNGPPATQRPNGGTAASGSGGQSSGPNGNGTTGGQTSAGGDGIDLDLKHFIVEKKELDSSCPPSPNGGVLLMQQQQSQQQLLQDSDEIIDSKDSKIFTSKADLQLHTQIHMREAKPYKCSQCNKAFANSSYLSQHTRIHLGIKPYRCEICQRKFTQLSHLQQHIRTHTGDKPYKCRHSGCLKAFSQLSNLQSHSRCHQTDKPFKCNSCYKCFSDEPSLLEHIPKHKESKHLKTHICQYCGKSYTQETYLSKHMQKHAERTDKRPPIGTRSSSSTVNLSASTPGSSSSGSGSASNSASATVGPTSMTAGESAYWPKVSPDSAAATINDVINQQNNHHEFSLTPNGSATSGSNGSAGAGASASGPQTNGGNAVHGSGADLAHHPRDDTVDELVGAGPRDNATTNGNTPNGQQTSQQQQQQQQQHNGTMNGNLAIPPVSTPMSASYDTNSIAKATSNSAFTPINAMPPHLNSLQHHHQLAAQRPSYLYDAISFQNQKAAAMAQSPSNAFPNQLISLHQIRNYAHQPAGGLMAGEHLLGVTVGPGGKDKG